MSPVVLAFLFAAGASVWVYTKLQNKTGYGNQKSAIIGSAVCFIIIFIVVLTLFNMILPASSK